VVQVGAPAQIVAEPADDYVRDFVSDVPRSHVLTLRYVCRAVEQEPAGAPVMQAEEIVRDAARKVLEVDGPVRVYDGDRFAGIVDDDDILRVVVAEESVR
jgi:glycine betaine/proline transport system ATP-binding protein